jgi:very-short-patch-repair endonuclease
MVKRRRRNKQVRRWLLQTRWISRDNLARINRFGMTKYERRLLLHWSRKVQPDTGYRLHFKHSVQTEQRAYTVDFFHDSGVVVQLRHLGDVGNHIRDDALAKAGFVVLHFVHAEISSFLPSVVSTVLSCIHARQNNQHPNERVVPRPLFTKKEFANSDVRCAACKNNFVSTDAYLRHCRLADGRYVCNGSLRHPPPLPFSALSALRSYKHRTDVMDAQGDWTRVRETTGASEH